MRIRSIKPEFYRSDDIDALTWDQRLVFIGVWSYVDDNGVGVDKLSQIVADLFAHDFSLEPTETLNRVSGALSALEKGGQIVRYSVQNKRFLYVANWDDHQRVNNPNKERYPRPTSTYVDPMESVNTPALVPLEELPSGAVEQWSSGAVEQWSSKNTSSPSVRAALDTQFEDFYEIYPRKLNKERARKAFTKAVKRVGTDRVLEGARRIAADPNLPTGDRRTFIPYPASWLNAGGWDNEPFLPEPVRARPAPSTSDARVAQGDAALASLLARKDKSA